VARKTRCQACGQRKWCQAHHVVWEQHGGTADARNLIPLCLACHYGYHLRSVRIRVDILPDAALDYAFELLGPAAHGYMVRRYDGGDPRLEARLEEELEALPWEGG